LFLAEQEISNSISSRDVSDKNQFVQRKRLQELKKL